ncbi:hypothetical protein RRG08_011087 [Elysia crispata]|uniref:Uncharacterized protein n=1 Tax=Elysia crispata TaxID=231223 RepID=A0AAE1DC30_9GAST|nr:hypothetical protein RRG08_011087 [Elysia crispata]
MSGELIKTSSGHGKKEEAAKQLRVYTRKRVPGTVNANHIYSQFEKSIVLASSMIHPYRVAPTVLYGLKYGRLPCPRAVAVTVQVRHPK